ncbi:MAG: hypothetical protein ABIY70_07990 [Capsulimonas sp.]|uniref:hypothetical protein n=1 Tax=Capsulimonas sp. TaxID=2494211 RepID=UPI003264A1E2
MRSAAQRALVVFVGVLVLCPVEAPVRTSERTATKASRVIDVISPPRAPMHGHVFNDVSPNNYPYGSTPWLAYQQMSRNHNSILNAYNGKDSATDRMNTMFVPKDVQ